MAGALDVGSEIAGYRVTGVLGRGGMGFVYEAEHLLLGRKAAIKTLVPELVEDDDFRERFISESQVVAALDHPNVIPIYDAGDADGIVYIAMRCVTGADLARGARARRGAASDARARDPRAGRRRPRRGARARPRPPRREARQRPHRGRRRARVPHRLRDRQAGAVEGPDADGLLRRDARLRGARADPGAPGRPACGRVRVRVPRLRVPHRAQAVRPRDGRRGHARAPPRPAAERRRAATRAPGRGRRRVRDRAGEGRGRPRRQLP